jgi:hypothetical protein
MTNLRLTLHARGLLTTSGWHLTMMHEVSQQPTGSASRGSVKHGLRYKEAYLMGIPQQAPMPASDLSS